MHEGDFTPDEQPEEPWDGTPESIEIPPILQKATRRPATPTNGTKTLPKRRPQGIKTNSTYRG